MFRFNYDVVKILQSGFTEGFIFGCALCLPTVALIFVLVSLGF